jgi:hypothetical protein
MLGMITRTTYPKFTSTTFIHFKLFQIYSNWSIQIHLKTTLQFENFFSRKVRILTRTPEQLSLYFYDFLAILCQFYKTQTFNPRSEDAFLQTGPQNEKLDYNQAQARPAVKMAGFRWGEGQTSPGKGGEVVLAHLGFRSEGWMVWRSGQRWSSAAPWILGRLGFCSGVMASCVGGLGAGEGAWGACGGGRCLKPLRSRPKEGLRQWQLPWRWRSGRKGPCQPCSLASMIEEGKRSCGSLQGYSPASGASWTGQLPGRGLSTRGRKTRVPRTTDRRRDMPAGELRKWRLAVRMTCGAWWPTCGPHHDGVRTVDGGSGAHVRAGTATRRRARERALTFCAPNRCVEGMF